MILWVDDDNPISLRFYLDELEEGGYKVIIARNPDEMLQMLAENSTLIKCIIMDILMPTGESVSSEESEMGTSTGLILLKRLREHQNYKEIPLVILTILSNQNIIEWARVNNVTFLKKQTTLSKQLLDKLIELQIPGD